MSSIQHVNLMVDDLEAAVAFYRDVIGLELDDTPAMDFPAQFMKLGGDQQIHLNQLPDSHPERAHFALRVDDFDGVVARATAAGAIEVTTWGRAKRLPSGVMQMFVRDPAGNLIEIGCDADQPVDPAFFERDWVEPAEA
jgi:catechol 2,3-dioxygenase-like lactoylglutathione lyase family enzyme